MSLHSDIESEVNRRVSERHGDVISNTFLEARKDHEKHAAQQGCQCFFCQRLSNYIGYKLRLHRINKRDREGDYRSGDDWMRLHLADKIRESRALKNQAKRPTY